MSAVNKRKATQATLHGTIFVPNIGQLGPSLSNKQTPTSKAIDMTVDEPFLVLRIGNSTVPVPLTNVTHLVLDKDPVGTGTEA